MDAIIRNMRRVKRAKLQYEAAQERNDPRGMSRAMATAERVRERLPQPYREQAGEDVTVGELEEYIAQARDVTADEEREDDPVGEPEQPQADIDHEEKEVEREENGWQFDLPAFPSLNGERTNWFAIGAIAVIVLAIVR